MKKNNIAELNNVTKILLIVLVIAVSYFIVFLIIKPFFITQSTSMTEMMNRVMRGDTSSTLINLLSLIIALIIGVIISFYLFKQADKGESRNKEREFNIIKKALSEDEKKILNEIRKAGEITQDSLRFRLGWSKAKISTILTNLDKKGIVQRERTGKTYRVYLEKFS